MLLLNYFFILAFALSSILENLLLFYTHMGIRTKVGDGASDLIPAIYGIASKEGTTKSRLTLSPFRGL